MKLSEGNWTIKCQMVYAADCAACFLSIITNLSVSFVLLPKKLGNPSYLFILLGCFQAMVSAFKIKLFPLVCTATRQLEPHELDNVVSFANVHDQNVEFRGGRKFFEFVGVHKFAEEF